MAGAGFSLERLSMETDFLGADRFNDDAEVKGVEEGAIMDLTEDGESGGGVVSLESLDGAFVPFVNFFGSFFSFSSSSAM